MTITAFSKKYKREIDAVQLLSMLGHNISEDPPLKKINQKDRLFIQDDVLCPSCGVSGAHIVSGSFNYKTNRYLRQPHFRFIFPDGSDGHDKFCDFAENPELKCPAEQLVDFSKSNSDLTRYIASLVCKSIESNLLSQTDIRNMRQWHFDKKKSAVVDIKVNVKQCGIYQFLRSQKNRKIEKFKPEYGTLKSFNWSMYAVFRFIEKQKSLIDKIDSISNTPYQPNEYQKALNSIGNRTFDIRIFEHEYNLVKKLCQFILTNDFGISSPGKTLRNNRYLDAFAALLLYIHEWNLDKAISKYIKIAGISEAEDLNLGNVIGLTPFVDFELYRNILETNEHSEDINPNFDIREALDKEEELLKREFTAWSKNN